MRCRNNNDTSVTNVITSISTISADVKYKIRLEVDHTYNNMELFIDDIFQGSSTNSHAQTWSQININIWTDIGCTYYMHCLSAYTSRNYQFKGTLHSYSLTTKRINLSVHHVQIPNVSSTVNTELRMYYNNSSAEDAQNATAVWDSGYKLVMHMSDLKDSTSNSNNGTNTGSILLTYNDGYCRNFDGDDAVKGYQNVNVRRNF